MVGEARGGGQGGEARSGETKRRTPAQCQDFPYNPCTAPYPPYNPYLTPYNPYPSPYPPNNPYPSPYPPNNPYPSPYPPNNLYPTPYPPNNPYPTSYLPNNPYPDPYNYSQAPFPPYNPFHGLSPASDPRQPPFLPNNPSQAPFPLGAPHQMPFPPTPTAYLPPPLPAHFERWHKFRAPPAGGRGGAAGDGSSNKWRSALYEPHRASRVPLAHPTPHALHRDALELNRTAPEELEEEPRPLLVAEEGPSPLLYLEEAFRPLVDPGITKFLSSAHHRRAAWVAVLAKAWVLAWLKANTEMIIDFEMNGRVEESYERW
ncbi:tyrosine-protein phosphatase non-receptor type 23-like [Eriocheir sinensis]|uniref:tyrosine-protein phosphatase non-receptor type 23-like n=1 Tax=Eriocheir sinensis TaxID=95602 RepID=UPI0021C8535A|nr:tyrosine-protein phosphatase non-receptor type 23-like [Eriocheir sinensis]